MYQNLAPEIVAIAKEAGKLILSFYGGIVEIGKKDDNSPVTEADLAANQFIVESLKKLCPDIPVVAEESPAAENARSVAKPFFWLVDPLDGTKSFIKKTGEFTVNIGLIKDSTPIGGVIYIPAKDSCYFTGSDGKAWKQEGRGAAHPIAARKIPEKQLVIVTSHSHMTPATENYLKTLPDHSTLSAASSLKFCMIAEGKADIYPRFGRTMEWDTAAGQAILTAAGGAVETAEGTPMLYRKKDFENTYFIARGKY